jgi:hypothetical protein
MSANCLSRTSGWPCRIRSRPAHSMGRSSSASLAASTLSERAQVSRQSMSWMTAPISSLCPEVRTGFRPAPRRAPPRPLVGCVSLMAQYRAITLLTKSRSLRHGFGRPGSRRVVPFEAFRRASQDVAASRRAKRSVDAPIAHGLTWVTPGRFWGPPACDPAARRPRASTRLQTKRWRSQLRHRGLMADVVGRFS